MGDVFAQGLLDFLLDSGGALGGVVEEGYGMDREHGQKHGAVLGFQGLEAVGFQFVEKGGAERVGAGGAVVVHFAVEKISCAVVVEAEHQIITAWVACGEPAASGHHDVFWGVCVDLVVHVPDLDLQVVEALVVGAFQLGDAPGVQGQRDFDEITVHQLPAAGTAAAVHDALDLLPDGLLYVVGGLDVLGKIVGVEALVPVEAEAFTVKIDGAEGVAVGVSGGVVVAYEGDNRVHGHGAGVLVPGAEGHVARFRPGTFQKGTKLCLVDLAAALEIEPGGVAAECRQFLYAVAVQVGAGYVAFGADEEGVEVGDSAVVALVKLGGVSDGEAVAAKEVVEVREVVVEVVGGEEVVVGNGTEGGVLDDEIGASVLAQKGGDGIWRGGQDAFVHLQIPLIVLYDGIGGAVRLLGGDGDGHDGFPGGVGGGNGGAVQLVGEEEVPALGTLQEGGAETVCQSFPAIEDSAVVYQMDAASFFAGRGNDGDGVHVGIAVEVVVGVVLGDVDEVAQADGGGWEGGARVFLEEFDHVFLGNLREVHAGVLAAVIDVCKLLVLLVGDFLRVGGAAVKELEHVDFLGMVVKGGQELLGTQFAAVFKEFFRQRVQLRFGQVLRTTAVALGGLGLRACKGDGADQNRDQRYG